MDSTLVIVSCRVVINWLQLVITITIIFTVDLFYGLLLRILVLKNCILRQHVMKKILIMITSYFCD